MKLSRRTYLKNTAAVAVSTSFPIKKAFSDIDPFNNIDATAQAALIKKKEITALELVDASIDRIIRLNPSLNAVVETSFEQARLIAKNQNSKGPFAGVPYLIKDLLNQQGLITSSGSKLFAKRVAQNNSSNVQAALDAGLISLGKTNTPEFGLLPTTESFHLGVAKNPWNQDYSTGGSSGGSAAAVASGMTAIASASDGGGSIRIPASCCGLVGLKPSLYRTIDSSQPNRPIDLSVRFVHTKTIRDSITALHAMQRKKLPKHLPIFPTSLTRSKKVLKIAMMTQSMLGIESDPEVKNATEETAKLCENLGHNIEIVKPFINGINFIDSFLTMWAYGAKEIITFAEQTYGMEKVINEKLLEPWTLGLGKWFDSRPENQVKKAVNLLKNDTIKTKGFFEEYDMLLTPVMQTTVPKLGFLAPSVAYDDLLQRCIDIISITPLANVTGEPAISLPLHWSSIGLPIGSHFQAGIGKEKELLQLALDLEEAKPWKNRRPI